MESILSSCNSGLPLDLIASGAGHDFSLFLNGKIDTRMRKDGCFVATVGTRFYWEGFIGAKLETLIDYDPQPEGRVSIGKNFLTSLVIDPDQATDSDPQPWAARVYVNLKNRLSSWRSVQQENRQ